MNTLVLVLAHLSYLLTCFPLTQVEAINEILFVYYAGSNAIPCSFTGYERTGLGEVCVQVLYINGTAQTTTNYTVTLSAETTSHSQAQNGIDFEFAPTYLTFPAGSERGDHMCVEFPIIDDDAVEYREIFYIQLNFSQSDELSNSFNRLPFYIYDDGDKITVSLLESSISVSEMAGSVKICMNVTHGSVESYATIGYYTSYGSATGYIDFQHYQGNEYHSTYTMSFSSGVDVGHVRCINVSITDDAIFENDESFTFSIQSYRDYWDSQIGRNSTVVTIIDNDEIVIGFPNGSPLRITEGINASISMCSQLLQGWLGRDLSMFITTTDISAQASSDYNPVSTWINFTANQTVGCISIDILDRNVLEGQETFQITLSTTLNLSRVSIPPGQESVVVIINEDPDDGITVGFQQTSYSTLEMGGLFSVCVEMFDGSLERNVSLTVISNVDGSATSPDDFTSLNTQLVFTSGQSAGAVVCANLDVIDDNVVEEDEETLTLTLSADDPSVTTITTSSARIAIMENDNDVDGSITLTSSHYDGYESDEMVRVCAVIMAEALERQVTIQLSSQDISARNIEDYTAFLHVLLTFTNGAVAGDEQCHTVTIVDDDILEEDEIFHVRMSAVNEPAFLGSNLTEATVTINHDLADYMELGFVRDSYSVSEQSFLNEITICIVINRGTLGREVVVNTTVNDISTDGGVDYEGPTPSTLTFIPGQTVGAQRCTSISVIDDSLIEDDETFSISLTAASTDKDAVRFTPTENFTNVTIVQDPNDRVVIQLLNTTDSGNEGDEIIVCAQLVNVSGGLLRPLTVNTMVLSGTAEYGEDFNSSLTTTLTFPTGSDEGDVQCSTISLLADILLETKENFVVELFASDPSVTLLETADIAIITIIDVPDPRVVAVSLVTMNYNTTEGTDMTVEVCAEVVIGTVNQTMTVQVQTINIHGFTIPNSDYSLVNTSLTFLPGDTVGSTPRCIMINILDDETVEADEVFSVVLSSRSFIQIVNTTSVNITIYEDTSDFIMVGLQPLLSPVTINQEFFVCAELTSGSLERDIFIGLEIENSSAINYVHFIGGHDPSILTFTSGQSIGGVQCANVIIVDDANCHGLRNFTISLIDNVNGAVRVNTSTQSIDIDIAINMAQRVSVRPSTNNVGVVEGGTGSDGSSGDMDDVDVSQSMVCLELASGSLQSNVSVRVMTVSSTTSTATVNEDYLNVEMNITFTSGQNAFGDNQQCFSVPILNDNILECNETFDILISPVPEDEPVVNITSDTITVIIEEDPSDYVEVGLLPLNRSVSENETFPVCALITAGLLGCNITVPLKVSTQNLTVGVDFVGPNPSSLIFTAGQRVGDTQCSEISILDDSIPQRERSFNISISSGGILGDVGNGGGLRVQHDLSSVVVDINIDITDLIQVGLADIIYEATEGPNTQVNVCVNIEAGSTTSNVTVRLMTHESEATLTATPVLDFTPIFELLTFTVGQSVGDSVCTQIVIFEDDYVEYVETFEVELLPTPKDSFKVLIVSGKDKATVMISDGERGRNVIIRPSVPIIVAVEGNGDRDSVGSIGERGSGDYQVPHSPNNTPTQMVCAQLVNGNLQRNITLIAMTVSSPTSTATVNADYAEFEINITFVSGQNATGDNEQCFYIVLLDDNVLEGNETFDILIRPTPEDEDIVNITGGIITVTIEEDPTDSVRIGLVDTRFTVTESVDTSITVCAELQEGFLERNVSLRVVNTDDSNATLGVDYLITPEILTFTSGQYGFDGILQCFNVFILDDQDTEHCEVLMITIVPEEDIAERVTIPTISSVASITIVEDPSDEVQLRPSESIITVTEGDNALICIQVSNGSLQRNIQVRAKILSGSTASTAASGEDFTDIMTTLTISSNQPACINLTILNDDILEGCEAFFVAFEVDPNFSGVAAIPRDADKSVVIIEEDLMDGVEVGFNQSNQITIEGQSQKLEMCVQVMSGTLQRNISVYLTTLQHSVNQALLGFDYRGVESDILTLGPGPDISVTCTLIEILDDDLLESTETVSLFLTPSYRDSAVVNISVQEATIEIVDDLIDGITVGVSDPTTITVYEGEDDTAEVCFELLNGELGTNVSLNIETRDNSAISDEDYSRSGLTDKLMLVIGQKTGVLSCINITIIDDLMVEGVENFSVVLTSDFPGVSVSRGLSVIEIIDNDEEITLSVVVTITTTLVVLLALFIILVILVILVVVIVRVVKKKRRDESDEEECSLELDELNKTMI